MKILPTTLRSTNIPGKSFLYFVNFPKYIIADCVRDFQYLSYFPFVLILCTHNSQGWIHNIKNMY